jgi:2-keto-3-deoxy-L-rhamnonate aldolase RhmA
MRPNPIRQKLARGETVMGMMHFTASPMIVEVMASAGLDFFIIDFEHSPIDIGMAAHLVRAGDAAGIAPLLRIPDVDAGLVKKVLNLGVQGIVLPHGTRQSCEALLNAVRYEPEGIRGSCPAVRQANYGPPDWKAFQIEANREILVIPLIEDPATVADMEALAAMDGLDVFLRSGRGLRSPGPGAGDRADDRDRPPAWQIRDDLRRRPHRHRAWTQPARQGRADDQLQRRCAGVPPRLPGHRAAQIAGSIRG